MTRITFSQLVAGILFSLCLATVPAEATVDHTYVSGYGTDTGDCAHASTACRTFAYAITQTTAAGVIIVMDAADYAPVTITKSISIVADAGGPAGIVVATDNALTISVGSADVVNLRGLTLEGDGTARIGIFVQSAGAVTISDCFAQNFSTAGIYVVAAGNVSILNSVTNDNSSSGSGMVVAGQGESKTFVTIRNLVANNNGIGFFLGNATVTFAGSMATGNSQTGIDFNSCCGETQVFSYGDNEISGTNPLGGTLTPLAKQ